MSYIEIQKCIEICCIFEYNGIFKYVGVDMKYGKNHVIVHENTCKNIWQET